MRVGLLVIAGVALIGFLSERRNVPGSKVHISATAQSTAKISTPVVDHGRNIAIRTASRSTLRMRAAGSCRAARTGDTQDAVWFVSSFTRASAPIILG